jgi:hypothetical protein
VIQLLRKYLVIPIVLLALSTVFVLLSIILAIKKGNHSILRKKLRIGGLILALQGLAVQGAWPGGSCYERGLPKVTVDSASAQANTLEVDLSQSSTVEAKILYGEGFNYTFIVLADDRVVQWGAVEPLDGKMDDRTETVIIALDPARFSNGSTYTLLIVPYQVVDLSPTLTDEPQDTIGRYQLIVKGE